MPPTQTYSMQLWYEDRKNAKFCISKKKKIMTYIALKVALFSSKKESSIVRNLETWEAEGKNTQR